MSYSEIMRSFEDKNSEECRSFMERFQRAFLASENQDPEGREAEALMEVHVKEAARQAQFTKLAANAVEMGSPEAAGAGLAEIAKFILTRIPEHKRPKAIASLQKKLSQVDPREVASKKMPEYSALGQAITFVKHVLIGHSPDYVEKTLRAISRHL